MAQNLNFMTHTGKLKFKGAFGVGLRLSRACCNYSRIRVGYTRVRQSVSVQPSVMTLSVGGYFELSSADTYEAHFG